MSAKVSIMMCDTHQQCHRLSKRFPAEWLRHAFSAEEGRARRSAIGRRQVPRANFLRAAPW
jgi:hypothetical protein